MASPTNFELSHDIEEQEGCKEIILWDDSGTYNATTNPTGYGAPNIASADVTEATILITPYGSTVGYLFTLTIVTNVITDAIVTDINGTVTNILADLTWDVFPFTETKPFIITGALLGNGADSQITFGAYDIEYNITDGTNVYVSTSEELIVCQVCCCVKNAAADLEVTDCSCQDGKADKAYMSKIYLDSAIFAMENGDVTKAVTNLNYAKELCEGKCKTC